MIVRYEFQIDVENQHRAEKIMEIVGSALADELPGYVTVANKNRELLEGGYFKLRFDKATQTA